MTADITIPVPDALRGLLSGTPLTGRCHADIYDRALKMSYQCSRKPGDQVGGIPLCTQHAAIARKLLAASRDTE